MPYELGVELLFQLDEIVRQRHPGGLYLVEFQVDAIQQFVRVLGLALHLLEHEFDFGDEHVEGHGALP